MYIYFNKTIQNYIHVFKFINLIAIWMSSRNLLSKHYGKYVFFLFSFKIIIFLFRWISLVNFNLLNSSLRACRCVVVKSFLSVRRLAWPFPKYLQIIACLFFTKLIETLEDMLTKMNWNDLLGQSHKVRKWNKSIPQVCCFWTRLAFLAYGTYTFKFQMNNNTNDDF